MSRKRHQGHFKRHNYPGDEPRRQRQDRGNGSGRGGGQHNHREPQYLTLAEGQQNPDFRELLKEKFSRLTVIIYGPRLSGTRDFEDTGDSTYRQPQDDRDPLETFGRFYAGDLLEDMFQHGFVCAGAKYRSRDENEFGDSEGKNYLYFQRRGDIRPDKKSGKIYYLRPHWADYTYIKKGLTEMKFKKVQLFLAPNSRGGIKHTLKLFSGTPRQNGHLEKPIWKAVAREWVLESVVPGQIQPQPERQQAAASQ